MSNINSPASSLAPCIRDLEDIVIDCSGATFKSFENLLARFVHYLDQEPLASFLQAELPATNFDEWYEKAKNSKGSSFRSSHLAWPPSTPERVALQIALCRAIVKKSIRFLTYIAEFMYFEKNLDNNIKGFTREFLTPLVRDIKKLTETRPLPAILLNAMRTLPTSGDKTLDDLLNEACKEFKDAAPTSRSEATKKLWDVFERLKTLEIIGDKRRSMTRLIEQSSPDLAFRELIELEATALTKIGNTFHIRHFETDKLPITLPEHNDYLFHRLYALIHLLLFSRGRQQGSD